MLLPGRQALLQERLLQVRREGRRLSRWSPPRSLGPRQAVLLYPSLPFRPAREEEEEEKVAPLTTPKPWHGPGSPLALPIVSVCPPEFASGVFIRPQSLLIQLGEGGGSEPP